MESGEVGRLRFVGIDRDLEGVVVFQDEGGGVVRCPILELHLGHAISFRIAEEVREFIYRRVSDLYKRQDKYVCPERLKSWAQAA